MSTSPMAHAQFPPSSMHRVLVCPASWKMERQAPSRPPHPAAVHGTFLHDVIAPHLIRGERPTRESVPPEVDKADLNTLQDHFDYISMILSTCQHPSPMTIERKVDLSEWGLDMLWGTPDVVIKDGDTIHILDHKFGITPVHAYRNAQLLIYAAGAAGCPPNYNRVVVHILQYRVFETPDTYECSVEDLELFIEEVREAIFEAQSANPSFHPDPHACQFCAGSMVCRARLEAEYANARKVLSGMKQNPMVSLEELSQFFNYTESVVKYRSQIGKYLTEKILSGEQVPAKRVVAGRGTYKWKNEAQLLSFMESNGVNPANVYTSKLMSPNQVKTAYRRFAKDEEFKALFEKSPGKPQLVDADDKRPDYLSLDDIDFSAL